MILSRIARPAQGLHVPVEKVSYFFFHTRATKLFAAVKKVWYLCTLRMWSYSVMVITQDSESCDPGSSPGRTLFFSFFDQIMTITDRGNGIAWIGATRCYFVCLNAREV